MPSAQPAQRPGCAGARAEPVFGQGYFSPSASRRSPESVADEIDVSRVAGGLVDHVRQEPAKVDGLVAERRGRSKRVERGARARGVLAPAARAPVEIDDGGERVVICGAE